MSWTHGLTFTHGIANGSADLYHLYVITGVTGDARVTETFLVGVRVTSARLAHSVVVHFAAQQHALPLGTLGAGLATLRQVTQVVAVVTNALCVVRVRTGRVHAVKTGALRAWLTFLCVTGIF